MISLIFKPLAPLMEMITKDEIHAGMLLFQLFWFILFYSFLAFSMRRMHMLLIVTMGLSTAPYKCKVYVSPRVFHFAFMDDHKVKYVTHINQKYQADYEASTYVTHVYSNMYIGDLKRDNNRYELTACISKCGTTRSLTLDFFNICERACVN